MPLDNSRNPVVSTKRKNSAFFMPDFFCRASRVVFMVKGKVTFTRPYKPRLVFMINSSIQIPILSTLAARLAKPTALAPVIKAAWLVPLASLAQRQLDNGARQVQ